MVKSRNGMLPTHLNQNPRENHFKIMELVLLAGKLFCHSEMTDAFTKLLCPRGTLLDKETMRWFTKNQIQTLISGHKYGDLKKKQKNQFAFHHRRLEPVVWDWVIFILIFLKHPIKHFVNIRWKIKVEPEPGSHVEQYSLQHLLRKSAWRRIVALPKSPSPKLW